jgi:hypothetical protein
MNVGFRKQTQAFSVDEQGQDKDITGFDQNKEEVS